MLKKKQSRFSAFRSSLGSYVNLFVFLALLLNLFVVYRFESTRKPQVVYTVQKVFVNTNISDVVSSPLGSSDVVSFPLISSPVSSAAASSSFLPRYSSVSNVVACSADYHYFLIGRDRCARMWDRIFYEGSLTSYGRIVTIFPDRILLDDGSWIQNSHWLGSVSSSRSFVSQNSSDGL